MSALRRDLLERRLWLLVAVLLVAIVGVPLLLLKSGPSVAADAGHAASGASRAAESVATDAEMKAGSALSEVLVRRRDPLAAAAPATTQSHAPSTTHSPLKNGGSPSSGTGSSSSSSGSGSSSSGSSGSSSPGSSGSGSSGSGSAPPPDPASVAPTTTVAPSNTTASEPVAARPRSWTIYALDVRFGSDPTAPIRHDLPRLTLLPSPQRPDVMFVGVLDGGRQAAFSIAPGVPHHGAGPCRPRKRFCSVILLAPGQTEVLTITGVNGTPQQARLHVTRIRRTVTHSRAAAVKAYHRVSAAGQCEVNLSQPLGYDGASGTLSAQGGSPCRYEVPSTSVPSTSASTPPIP
jgi:hypothetical protein